MKMFFVISILVYALSAAGGQGQVTTAPVIQANEAQLSDSPAAAVARRFVQLDTSATRLTREGWRSAAMLFESPKEERPKLRLTIISSHYALSKLSQDSHEAEFYFGYEVLGTLNDRQIFTPSRNTGEVRGIWKFKVVAVMGRSIFLQAEMRTVLMVVTNVFR
jgi:23S rRNA C2498 (ribose-2'-O)-methylase RlmM